MESEGSCEGLENHTKQYINMIRSHSTNCIRNNGMCKLYREANEYPHESDFKQIEESPV